MDSNQWEGRAFDVLPSYSYRYDEIILLILMVLALHIMIKSVKTLV